MKRNIRKIGLILVLGLSIISCTKEVEILEPKLTGSYKIESIITDLPVDLDKDGVANIDMSKEKDHGHCRFDDTFSFNNGNKGIWADGSDICSNALEPSDYYFNYIYDKAKKTISMEIFIKGETEREFLELTDVFVSYKEERQTLKFSFYDERYTNRIVTYYLVSY